MLGQIHLVIEDFPDFRIAILNWHVPVNVWRIKFFTPGIFCNKVLFVMFITQNTMHNGIPHPIYKLTVFVICDFCLVHVKCLNRNRFGLYGMCILDFLVAWPHYKTTHRNKEHSERIRLPPNNSVLHSKKLPASA